MERCHLIIENATMKKSMAKLLYVSFLVKPKKKKEEE